MQKARRRPWSVAAARSRYGKPRPPHQRAVAEHPVLARFRHRDIPNRPDSAALTPSASRAASASTFPGALPRFWPSPGAPAGSGWRTRPGGRSTPARPACGRPGWQASLGRAPGRRLSVPPRRRLHRPARSPTPPAGPGLPSLKAEAYVFAPTHWVVAAPDGLTFTRPAGGPVTVTARLLRASVNGWDESAAATSRWQGDDLTLDAGAGRCAVLADQRQVAAVRHPAPPRTTRARSGSASPAARSRPRAGWARSPAAGR